MKRIVPKVLFFACLVAALCSCGRKTDGPLRQVDDILSKKEVYERSLLDRIQVLREVLSETDDPQRAYEIRKRIAGEFYSYRMDSTILYYQANRQYAIESGDRIRQAETEIQMASEYILAGYYLEAKGLLEGIDPDSLPAELGLSYKLTLHSLVGEALVYSSDPTFQKVLNIDRDHYRNLLLDFVPEGTWEWHNLKMEEADLSHDRAGAFYHARFMTELSSEFSHSYAKGCYFCYLYSDDEAERLDWLVRSVISDVMCATKDYASLSDLAEILFRKGDIDRAFRYMAYHCMPDAIFFGGKLRPWQIAQVFPEIQRAYQNRALRQRRFMVAMLIALSVLVLMIGLLTLILFRRQRILDEMRLKLSESYAKLEEKNNNLLSVNQRVLTLNRNLEEANQVKVSFIALFLSILSKSINETRQYKNHVLRLIRQGAATNVAQEIEALPPIEEDIADFYKMFDKTFVDLYPNFVEKFNGLLREGETVYPKGEDLLTPELRIFALIKMGITDSGKIASLLHYSVNTIYNYRAKMKNRAKGDRTRFEQDVRDL
ncbi:MAG: DUF6377 domain-containing protein [Bacteroidales bacterium]|nr:DUF6377 domain-containing protein [Bacteroidales bacterium]